MQELLTEPGRQVILVPAPKVAANVQAVFSQMSGGRTRVATSADSLRGLSMGVRPNPYFGWSRVPRTTVNGLQISNCFGNCTRPPVRGVVQNSQFSCRTNGVDRWMAPVCSSMNGAASGAGLTSISSNLDAHFGGGSADSSSSGGHAYAGSGSGRIRHANH